jgi:DNA-binding FrmR family transcriptional regulator
MNQSFTCRESTVFFLAKFRILCTVGCLCAIGADANSQSTADQSLRQQLQQLTDAMTHTQAQLEESQKQLKEIRGQLEALQRQLAESESSSSSVQLAAAVNEIREQQLVEAAQIATHEQSKVESESKYPVKLSGLVLLNGFVNTKQVDIPSTPTIVLPGQGTTGASVRQTILGIDARGPHLFNAQSHADVRVDFAGDTASPSYATGSSDAAGFMRLRTAHADLHWDHAEAFFSLDHPIIAPNTPTSLTATALPELAWSGNLWAWSPQAGFTSDVFVSPGQRLRMQGAVISVPDASPIYSFSSIEPSVIQTPTTAEQSRWPGIEGRIALLGNSEKGGLQLGVGGIVAPHRVFSYRFNTWAGTLDYRVPFTSHTELSGAIYRGQALGGLGGGAYKDYLVRPDPEYPGRFDYDTPDTSGGWAQLKQRVDEHLEFNVAFGTDQMSAAQLRPYAGEPSAVYLNLARNRTYVGNVIYSPSSYLLFSLEYRHLQTSPVIGSTATGDVIGIATGYRF